MGNKGQKTVNPIEQAEEFKAQAEKWEGFGLVGLDDGRYPAVYRKTMKPEYRLVALLKASGMKNVRIAQAMNLTPGTVETIARQPAIKAMIRDAQLAAGVQGLRARVEQAGHRAMDVMISLMESEACPESTRVRCAEYVLDQTLGKAVNFFGKAEDKPDPFENVRQVEEKIGNIARQLRDRFNVDVSKLVTGGTGEGSTT